MQHYLPSLLNRHVQHSSVHVGVPVAGNDLGQLRQKVGALLGRLQALVDLLVVADVLVGQRGLGQWGEGREGRLARLKLSYLLGEKKVVLVHIHKRSYKKNL